MYAIVRTGGRQHRVEKGDVVRVDRLGVRVGETVTLEDVLLVGDASGTRVGTPRVANAKVVGTVLDQERGAKIRVFKYKKRKHYRRTKGHRQACTALRIEAVEG